MSFKDSKKLAAANSAITTYAPAELAVDTAGGYTLCNDGRYEVYDQYYDTSYSTVDNLKNISVDSSQINITQETNSQYMPFRIPRYWDGIDLMDMLIQIRYQSVRDNKGQIANVINVASNETSITFGWLIDANVTANAGDIIFEIMATGSNEKGHTYTWRTRPNGRFTVLQGLNYDGIIEPTEDWYSSFVNMVMGHVNEAKQYAEEAKASAASVDIEAIKSDVESTVTQNISVTLADTYYTKTQIDQTVNDINKSISSIDGLKDFKAEYNNTTGVLSFKNKTTGNEICDSIAINSLSNLKVEYSVVNGKGTLVFKNGDTELQTVELSAIEPSAEWTAALKEGIATETDAKLSPISEKITALEESKTNLESKVKTNTEEIHTLKESVSGMKDSVDSATNAASEAKNSVDILKQTVSDYDSQFETINRDITDAKANIEELKKNPASSEYDVEYEENIFKFIKDGEIQKQFKIEGGGGTSDTSTITIERITSADAIFLLGDPAIIEYNFTSVDNTGDSTGDGTAVWKVGSTTVATTTATQGKNKFDITEYLTVGSNSIRLTITDSFGTLSSKTWTVTVVEFKLESTFDDTLLYTNTDVVFRYTPYGNVNKTIHFYLDGEELGTTDTQASGRIMSYNIPKQEHGSHLLKVYMTATINNKDIVSNTIYKDIICVDPANRTPIIGCAQQEFEAQQYHATSVKYVVYDPDHNPATVKLSVNGKVVSALNADRSAHIWSYKSSDIGQQDLTISCRKVTKIIKAVITKLDIDVEPITANLAFDFNPVGRSNGDANKLWSDSNHSDIAMTVSDNFDWDNGGYQIDPSGNQYFCVKAGTSASISYNLFGRDPKQTGAEFKLVFKTQNVRNASATFLSCIEDADGSDVGIKMNVHEAYVNTSTDKSLYPNDGAQERMIVANDGAIEFYTGCQDGIGKAAHTIIDSTGLFSGTAAKANAVPWSGITGKPSTFPPSDHSHAYLPLAGGSMTGNIKFNTKWNNYIGEGNTDNASEVGGDLNNLVIASWWGVSFTTPCANQKYTNKTAVGIDCRNGIVKAAEFRGAFTGNASTATALTTSAGSATQPVYFSSGKPVACSYTIATSVPSGAKFTDTNTWRPLGTTGDTACAGNDSRLSNARPASDVYSWAKASSKPSYSWSEIGSKPSTFTPSSHTHETITGKYTGNGGQQNPSYISNGIVRFNMMNTNINNDTSYKDFILMDTYAGNDVPYVTALGLSKTASAKAFIMAGKKGGSSWDYKAELLSTSNYTSYAATKGHTHSSIKDVGNSTNTTFAYSKAGMNYADYTWLAGWNGFELRAINKSQFAISGHTHNYAGSSSVGGSANSAVKLATARTVSGGTDITISYSYDGSANSSANIGFYGSAANVGDKNNYPFHRFAKLDTITGSYTDKASTFYISQDYNGGGFGIVRIVLRTNNNSSVSSVEVKWLVRCGLNADSVQVGLYNVFGKTYADAFFKTGGSYAGTYFRAIANGGRATISRTWVMVNSSEVSGTTTTDAKTSTECYVTIAAAGTKLHNQAYTNIVSGSDSGTVSYSNSTGSASTSTKLTTARNIFGKSFNGTADVAGQGLFYGTYTSTASNRFSNSGLQIRENGLVGKNQTDIGYAPTIGFHWSNRIAATLAFGSDGIFYFRKQNGADRATIDANVNGNASSASSVAWANVSGKPAIVSKTIKSLTSASASGWTNLENAQTLIPDMSVIVYWNGAYSNTSSNLAYCNKGAFGTIVTKNAGDYATAGHTHHYAGSSSAGGSATSAVKLDTSTAGSATQPVYFTGGKPVACTYTLGKSVPSNAVFTDTNNKMTQTAITSKDYTNWRTILWGASNSGTEGFTPTTVTDGAFTDTNLSYQPSTGTLRAKVFKGRLSGNADTATSANTAKALANKSTIGNNTTSQTILNFMSGADTSTITGDYAKCMFVNDFTNYRFGLKSEVSISSSVNTSVVSSEHWLWYTDLTSNEMRIKNSVEDISSLSEALLPPVLSDSGTGRVYSLGANTSSKIIKFRIYNNGAGQSATTVNVTYSTSDIRLKDNVKDTDIKDALSVINKMKIRQFDWKDDNKHQKIGFVADELEELDDKLVVGGGWEDEEHTQMNVKGVDTFYMMGYVVKGMQELSEQIKVLTEENKELKKQIEGLKREG